MRLQRALFVSGSLGKGHDVVAEACAAALSPFGVESRIVDSMRLLGGRAGRAGDWVFRKMLSVPATYDAFHTQLRGDGRLGRVADRAAIGKMHGALSREVLEFGPQLVVPVFATGAGATARLRREGHAFKSVVIMTDSFAHRMWVHEGTDLFLVTSLAAAESVRRYWPEAPVSVVAAPVRPEFHVAPCRRDARAALGVPDDATCVLIMSGAWGIGPLDEAAEALAADGNWVLAVAGTNTTMERSLRGLAGRHPSILPFGYTDEVAVLMSAADVVVTSSGDTCREARALGRGIVLIDVVPGHGRENLQHELELGGSTACLPTAGSVARAVRSFLADPARSKVAPDGSAGAAEGQFVDAVRSLGLQVG